MGGSNGSLAAREEVLQALRAHERFCLTTHERPDGDAVGSLAAMQGVLSALGKEALAFLPADEFPLPYEYRFIELNGLVTEPPADLAERVLIFLDCGNIDRSPVGESDAQLVINVDHHHDNTRFGIINHVDPHASCTAEMVWDLAHGLGVQATTAIAEALYVGLVTDTGRFMYENTGPRAHEMAAELIAGGLQPHEIYRHLYEGVPQGKLVLLARGLTNVERFDDGLLTVTQLTEDDYRLAGADESFSEGVVDHLRSVEGTAVAGLVRAQLGGGGTRKVSLRATDDRIDVSAIARAGGGGGHRRAAGFSTELDFPELVTFLREQLAQQLDDRRRRHSPSGSCRWENSPGGSLSRWLAMTDGVLLVDKPAGVTSHDVVARIRRGLPKGTKVGHAGTLDPFATGLLLILVGRATRVQRFLMGLPKRYETVARLGFTSTTGDPEGEIKPGTMPGDELHLPTGIIKQTPPAYSAIKIKGKRAYALARAGEDGRDPRARGAREPLRAPLARVRPGEVRDRVLLRHLRALADHGLARRVLRRAAPDADRRLRRRGRVRGTAPLARRRAVVHARGRAQPGAR